MSVGPAAARWLISGRVQGVGFRWFVLREAEKLGVQGCASNWPDGKVEVVGVADQPILAEFERALATGPMMARVDNVEKVDLSHDVPAYKSFSIR
ncbi:MAG: acylphosphatase [Gemmatimonadales bacterium]